MDDLKIPPIVQRRKANPKEPFLPFEVKGDRRVSDFLPIGGDRPVRQTSSTHGINGYITTEPEEKDGPVQTGCHGGDEFRPICERITTPATP